MKIYASFMNSAYLLGCDGQVISVENHPLVDYEFDDIVFVLKEYGDTTARHLACKYENDPSEELKQQLLEIYDNSWCKVREWKNGRLVTFRLTSTNRFNWYPVIVNFLLDNPCYKNSNITVESDKRTGYKRTYWNELPYSEATMVLELDVVSKYSISITISNLHGIEEILEFFIYVFIVNSSIKI